MVILMPLLIKQSGNKAEEAIEASEVAEDAEVNEAAEVSKAQKITTEDFIGSCIPQFGDKNNLSLMCCKKKISDRIMKTHFEF